MSAAAKFPPRSKLIAVLALTCLAGCWLLPQYFSLSTLSEHDEAIRGWCRAHTPLALLLLFLGYTTITAASIPAAALMTMVAGWVFGFWPAFIVISFASTLGATCAFLISRTLLQAAMQRHYGTIALKLARSIEHEGAAVVLLLRLAPTFPFFLVNILLALSPIRLRTFWWASQLGMLPGTAVFVAAGASLPSLKTLETQGTNGVLNWQTAAAFLALACLPVTIRLLLKYIQRKNTTHDH